MYRLFDGVTMRGATVEDNNTLIAYINRDLEYTLTVDENDRVFDAQERYIADVIHVDAGDGLLCDYNV